MKILFISREKAAAGISPIVANQGASIARLGHDVDYFAVTGRGIGGYRESGRRLRAAASGASADVYHAHYALSGFVAALAGCRPLVVSLMGSEVNENAALRTVIRFFNRFGWDRCIVKSRGMAELLSPARVEVVPNGVDCRRFRPLNREDCLRRVRFRPDRRNVLFLADPRRPEKNFALAEAAVALLADEGVVLHAVSGAPSGDVVRYLNAADCLLLTSTLEGSPNAVKEAMACGRPVVSTDVGDVRWILGGVEGCHLAAPAADDVARKLRLALDFGRNRGRTRGRGRILELGLDSASIARRIDGIYAGLAGGSR
jgi:teichuronic acid biosynthesis glycosyltransferase TuaC